MKIIHQGGFSDAELAEFRSVVYKNVLESAQHIIIYLKKIGVKFSNQVPFYLHPSRTPSLLMNPSQALTDKVMKHQIRTFDNQASFAPEIAEAIHQLVKDLEIPKLINEHSSEFYLMDSVQ